MAASTKVMRVGHIKSLTPKKFVFLSKDSMEDTRLMHMDSIFEQHRQKKISLGQCRVKDYGMIISFIGS